ncbi:hypothetical protein [Ktedonospora formicarum]|nr:hypothetical protein [Ktedonospora formicarum]
MLQRIIQRLRDDCETMTAGQRMLVKQRLDEWRGALDQLSSDLEI